MTIRDLVTKNRSCRRFFEDSVIERGSLVELVELARLSASAANLQPLRYILSCERERNGLVFEQLEWAGYLKDWSGPAEGERPAGYIIIVGDRRVSGTFGCDHGIVAQSILLGAAERGLGGCMVGSIHRAELAEALDIASDYKILLVIALGRPREEVVIETVGSDGDIKYWRDSEGRHHVPKRPLDDIIIG